jgi:pimeloyl-ACP methyl ester carboxylesterase
METSSWMIGFELLALLWLFPVGAAAVLLLCVADTWQGRVFAFAALLLAALPRAICRAFATRTRSRTRTAVWLAGGAVTLCVVLTVSVARTKSSVVAEAGIREVFTGRQNGWLRYSPTNLVPEGDQVAFIFTLMPVIDPILTQSGASRLRNLSGEIYRELGQDRDFRTLGSAMPEVYAGLCGFQPSAGQVFVYAPKTPKPLEARPALVFFHGSGGNFKAYCWVLAELARRLDCVLIAPSSGMGNWDGQQSRAALASALEAGSRVAAIDRNQIHVIGLSNGGRAVSQLGASSQGEIKTLTFISPVFDAEALGSLDSRHRVLMVTGDLDDRVPLSYVQDNAAKIMRHGVAVELRTFLEADHFLMFSHRRELVETIARWLKKR